MFTALNYKSYKHKYYLGYIEKKLENAQFQESELSDMRWFNYNKIKEILRPYNYEKLEIIEKINKLLNDYRLYY